jgi:hypothetical protein
LLVEAATGSPKENGYVPALDINRIDVGLLFERLEVTGEDRLMAEKSKKLNTFVGIQRSIYDAIYKSPANKLLKDL